MFDRSAATARPRRRSSADLCCWLACVLSACTLGGPGHELIVQDAGMKRAGAGSPPPTAADASAGNPATVSGSSAAASSMPTPMSTAGSAPSAAAVGGSAAGTAGVRASSPASAPTAGASMADSGITPGTDQTTCSINFAACVTLNPLGFVDCATQAGPSCPEILFGGDAGQAPSPACSMQEASCLASNPGAVAMCMAMLASCTL